MGVLDLAAPRLWMRGPEVAQVPTGSLPVRDGVAGTRLAATGSGRARQMSALASGYSKREIQPLPELTDGIADTGFRCGVHSSHAHCTVWSACPKSAHVTAVRNGHGWLGIHQPRRRLGIFVRLPLAWASTGVDCGQATSASARPVIPFAVIDPQ